MKRSGQQGLQCGLRSWIHFIKEHTGVAGRFHQYLEGGTEDDIKIPLGHRKKENV